MNPLTDPTPPPPQPPQPPQPHRPSTSCDRHPDEHFTGFCPSCLCERLAVLEPTSSAASSSTTSRKPPTSSSAAAAFKSIFKPSVAVGGGGGNGPPSSSSRPPFFPELRRTKSFSASKNNNESFSGVFEPQRRSCDVRVRNTLWSLFNQDDERNPYKRDSASSSSAANNAETTNLTSSARPSFQGPVFESKEEEEEEQTETESETEIKNDNIRVSEEPNVGTLSNVVVIEERNKVGEIVEEVEEDEEEGIVVQEIQQEEEILEEELKPMKDHIDLDSQTKKQSVKDFAGSFWSATYKRDSASSSSAANNGETTNLTSSARPSFQGPVFESKEEEEEEQTETESETKTKNGNIKVSKEPNVGLL